MVLGSGAAAALVLLEHRLRWRRWHSSSSTGRGGPQLDRCRGGDDDASHFGGDSQLVQHHLGDDCHTGATGLPIHTLAPAAGAGVQAMQAPFALRHHLFFRQGGFRRN